MSMKALFTSALILGLSLQTHAHAIIVPALGIPGNQGATRNDVQRPSNDAPCGKVDIMTALASATPVVAQGDGSFEVNVTNFNGGKDGSRQVQAEVDPTAFGKNFTSATVTQNGDLAPSSVGTQIVTVKLPDGLSCSGGQSNDLCLVSFKTAAGFGNCVVVQQKLDRDAATSTSAAGSASSCQSAQQESSKSSLKNGVEVIYLRAKGTRAARVYRRMYP